LCGSPKAGQYSLLAFDPRTRLYTKKNKNQSVEQTPSVPWLPNNGEPSFVIRRLDLEEQLCASGLKAKHEEIDELKPKIWMTGNISDTQEGFFQGRIKSLSWQSLRFGRISSPHSRGFSAGFLLSLSLKDQKNIVKLLESFQLKADPPPKAGRAPLGERFRVFQKDILSRMLSDLFLKKCMICIWAPQKN